MNQVSASNYVSAPNRQKVSSQQPVAVNACNNSYLSQQEQEDGDDDDDDADYGDEQVAAGHDGGQHDVGITKTDQKEMLLPEITD